MKRSLSAISVLLVAAIFLAGCGANSPQTNPEGQTEQTNTKSTLLEQIKAAGVLRVGTEGTSPPFTFHDKTGELTGFDVDIAREVAKRLGVKPQFIESKWDGLFAGLAAKRFDVVINEVSIRPERQARYDFSQPYITAKSVLIVRQDNQSIKDFTGLKGKKAAEALTSQGEKLAKSFGAEVVPVDGFSQKVELLKTNRVDATISDNLSYLDLKKHLPNAPIKVVAELAKTSHNAVLFNKGNQELVAAVNQALADMKANGTYLKLSEKWFAEDVSK